eukprot:m.9754 g.9754  ORF g.9754 m.9754 type:complete len:126 (+) comp6410_c0_seq2:164-541(+)
MSFYNNRENVALFGPDPKSVNRNNYICAGVTLVAIITSLALMFTKRRTLEGSHVFFALTIIVISIPELIIVWWYRQGDLPPKFKYLIMYMMLAVVLFCLSAVLYYYEGDKFFHQDCNSTTLIPPV